MSLIVVFSTLALVLGLYITWLVHSKGGLNIVVHPQTEELKQEAANGLPLISVVIPARNEGKDIRLCLQALLSQTYANFEVIVVDDRSTDDTFKILTELAESDLRMQVIQGAELPPDWVGKPHALFQGAAAAHGEWLCFMDADTFANPELIRATYHLASQQHADMFSILTEQILGSFWERAILPLVFLGLAYGFPAEYVNDPDKPDAISNGQFILVRRAVYEHIGGHTAVKDRIDDDKTLAAIVKHAGFRLILADGREVARTRMYTSLPEMWEGWTKNIYLGLLDKLWLLLFGASLGLMVALILPLWLVGAAVWLASGGGVTAALVTAEALILWGYLLRKRYLACRYFKIPGWYCFTFPLGALLFTLMMLASAFNVLSGRGVSWKGRRYHSVQ